MTAFEKAARDHIVSRASPGTRDLYARDLKRWLFFCAQHRVDPGEPPPALAVAYRDALGATQKSQTIRRTLAALSRMYRVALNAWPRAAVRNPFDSDALARPPASDFSKTEAITREEALAIFFRAALDPAHGVCDVAILHVLDATGLRISAAVTMLREKLFQRDGITIARVRTKRKDEVDVELPAAAVAALDRWLEIAPPSKYVFPSTRKPAQPLGRQVFWKRLKQYGAAVGVAKMHPHRFRATFITDALDVLPPHEVQAAVHHSSFDTTRRYDRRIRGKGVTAAVAAARAKQKPSDA